MKKLVLSWSLFLSIVYGSDTFLLPDQSSDALYALKQKIKASQSTIVLLTPSDVDTSLRRTIVKRLSHDVAFQLITSSAEIAASFAIYKNSDVNLLRNDDSKSLQLNLLLIDEKTGCLSTVGLNNTITRTKTAIIKCSSSPEDITFYKSVIERLNLRSDPYFK